jgi:hypothetical protein
MAISDKKYLEELRSRKNLGSSTRLSFSSSIEIIGLLVCFFLDAFLIYL